MPGTFVCLISKQKMLGITEHHDYIKTRYNKHTYNEFTLFVK